VNGRGRGSRNSIAFANAGFVDSRSQHSSVRMIVGIGFIGVFTATITSFSLTKDDLSMRTPSRST